MARAQKKLGFRFHEIATQVRNDKVFGLRPKRSLIRSVLINGLCDFEDGTRAATAASKSSVGLDGCTRMRGVLLRSCHAGEVA